MIDSQRDSLSVELATIISYPTSATGIIFLENTEEKFLDMILLISLYDSLMVAITRVWYNGSYTMAPKRIKSLEMHYKII